jgi:hypothetical protein
MYGTHPVGHAGPWKNDTADGGIASPTAPPPLPPPAPLLALLLELPLVLVPLPEGPPPDPELAALPVKACVVEPAAHAASAIPDATQRTPA